MRKLSFFVVLALVAAVCLPCLALAGDAANPPEGADMAATILGWLPENWEGWVTFVVTVCAAVSAVWPRPAETANPVLRLLYMVVNALGFNAGKAKNADDALAVATEKTTANDSRAAAAKAAKP